MSSLTYTYSYRNYDVMIIGYQLPGGWRMAVEVRWGEKAELLRDTENLYPDFNSLRSLGIWQAHQMIRRMTDSPDNS